MSHQVELSDIEQVDIDNLKEYKLKALEDGQGSDQPVTLQRAFGTPYRILDGNHRVYLARQQGNSQIEAIFDDER
jgi:hypothetical protein